MGGTWTIGKIFGIEIRIDASWLIIFFLITWTLGGSYFPEQYEGWSQPLYWGVGLVTSVLFFASVLGHELAHSLVAKRQGEEVKSITLFIFGGVAGLTREPDKPSKEFTMALLGPVASFGFAIIFGVLWFIFQGISEPIAALTRYLAYINVALGAFNLIPGFPLDGGRVLRSIIWGVSGNLKQATRAATWVGQGVALLFIFFGVSQAITGSLLNGLWIAFIGWFLFNAAASGYRQMEMRELLHGVSARDIMSRDLNFVPPQLSLQELVDQYFLRSTQHAFLVGTPDDLLGIICPHDVQKVAPSEWVNTRVRDAMTPRQAMEVFTEETEGNVILERLSARDIHQAPVMSGQEVVGILRRNEFISFLQQRSALMG
jgi:Zn-dependent protease/predicted transcriptional regulator